MAVLHGSNKFILPKKMSKSSKNIDYLVRLGVPFERALAICGYSKEEGDRFRDKLGLSLSVASLNNPDSDNSEDVVDISVSVGDTGLIRRKYD